MKAKSMNRFTFAGRITKMLNRTARMQELLLEGLTDPSEPNRKVRLKIYASSAYQVNKGDVINVEGHIKAGWDAGVYMQQCIADSITPASSAMETFFSLPGQYYSSHGFCLALCGTIVNRPEMYNEWMKFVLRVDAVEGESSSDICLNIGPKLLRMQGLSANMLHPGTQIATICDISTKVKKDSHGKQINYDNLNVRDIAILVA